MIVLLTLNFDIVEKAKENPLLVMAGLGAVAVALGLGYLSSADSGASPRELERMKLDLQISESILKKQVASLEKRIEVGSLAMTPEQRKELVSDAAAGIQKDAIRSLFKEQVAELEGEWKIAAKLEEFSKARESSLLRLSSEIKALRLRANLSLMLGLVISGIGVYILFTTITLIDAHPELQQLANDPTAIDARFFKTLLLPMFPRTLLAIFIEVLAYFFLKLYKENLRESKYFQNELTNLEAKLIAVQIALATGPESALTAALSSLSSTERNFVLNKGQTTVELERAKQETEGYKAALRTIQGGVRRRQG